ncbi:hypothetical protein OIDMADRAFT_16768 [Oidiodendron maius Zn]|uniref:Uncharacterized protein n=1 Tax=Oidiodendron maius (strain Zn) TaxID=913774 RepID=A0A0C3I155_OIDMZ|nr:hypothetical protein OIDMADRAFT_16768 [Oidiodendron maius Zn]
MLPRLMVGLPSFRRYAKVFFLFLCWAVAFHGGIFTYLEELDNTYVTSILTFCASWIRSYDFILHPLLVYVSLQIWRVIWSRTYREFISRLMFILILVVMSLTSFPVAWGVIKWFYCALDKLYETRAGRTGICLGECWKVWTELALFAAVFISAAFGWDLDGGYYRQAVDKAIEKRKQEKEAEKAAKAEIESLTVAEEGVREKV